MAPISLLFSLVPFPLYPDAENRQLFLKGCIEKPVPFPLDFQLFSLGAIFTPYLIPPPRTRLQTYNSILLDGALGWPQVTLLSLALRFLKTSRGKS